MSQHRDDTTELPGPTPAAREREPGSYYYDDATGYEPYDPAQAEDDERDEAEPGAGAPAPL